MNVPLLIQFHGKNLVENKIDNYINVTQYGSKLYVKGLDSDKNKVQFVTNEFPITYFLESQESFDKYSVYRNKLKQFNFSNIQDARDWHKRIKDAKLKIYGDEDLSSQYIANLAKKSVVNSSDLNILYYDIETTVSSQKFALPEKAEESCTLISAYDNRSKKVHLFYYQDFKLDEKIKISYDVVYHKSNNEKELLLQFVNYWKMLNPDVVSGWNTNGFDNVYIYFRLMKLFNNKIVSNLSPFGVVSVRQGKSPITGNDQYNIKFLGVATLDYLDVYKKFVLKARPNYQLDTIAEIELGENKISHAGSFKEFYTNEWDTFVSYNIRDTELVVKLNEKLKLLDIAIKMSYICNVNYDDVLGTVKKVESLIADYLKKDDIVTPYRKSSIGGTYGGGFVQDPVVGMHTSLVSYDVTSLYPSVTRQHNISPETIVENAPEEIEKVADAIRKNPEDYELCKIDTSPLKGTPYTISPTGTIFRNDFEGIIPKIMSNLFVGRKTTRKQGQVHQQNAERIKEELKRRGIEVH